MAGLGLEGCVPCRVGATAVAGAQAEELRAMIPRWRIVEQEGVRKLERDFRFKDFAQALAFTVGAGELAERHGHHPALLTEWGRVRVTFWTHKIKGLHRNDFIMAAKTDGIFEALAALGSGADAGPKGR